MCAASDSIGDVLRCLDFGWISRVAFDLMPVSQSIVQVAYANCAQMNALLQRSRHSIQMTALLQRALAQFLNHTCTSYNELTEILTQRDVDECCCGSSGEVH